MAIIQQSLGFGYMRFRIIETKRPLVAIIMTKKSQRIKTQNWERAKFFRFWFWAVSAKTMTKTHPITGIEKRIR